MLSNLRSRLWGWLALLCALTGLALFVSGTPFAQNLFGSRQPAADAVIAYADLPEQARHTLRLIVQGGPFPYAKDGSTFGNYERRLPRRPRGYYSEYTVRTPGVRSRGARRIIAGRGTAGRPADSAEYWYTADHYRSFSRIQGGPKHD